MLRKTLEKALIRAIREAKNHNHEYVTVEHMLYGLLHDDLTNYIINECGGSTDVLKERLEQFFVREIPKLSSIGSGEPAQTIAFNRVLQRAVFGRPTPLCQLPQSSAGKMDQRSVLFIRQHLRKSCSRNGC